MTKMDKKQAFENWWFNLPQKEVPTMKQQIMERCFISRFTFVFWLSGRTEIPTICLNIIEDIARKKIFKRENINA